MKEYYYEIGVMPTGDIKDAYISYIKTEKELDRTELIKSKCCIYIQPCTKELYEWSKK
jgi:hypothetical protein